MKTELLKKMFTEMVLKKDASLIPQFWELTYPDRSQLLAFEGTDNKKT